MAKSDEMKKIHDEVVALKHSPLYVYRTENNYVPVIGNGSLDASIMFVGEAPGEKEAQTGQSFCGRSGKVLDALFASVGIEREDVYITSIVKDRPPKNRDPLPAEIALYAPFLDRQISILKPKVIATLGRFSMQYVMSRYGLAEKLAPISALHGQVFETEIEGQKVKIIPLYHPAAAIYNQKLMKDLQSDFQVLKGVV